jgi:hypothetical protein
LKPEDRGIRRRLPYRGNADAAGWNSCCLVFGEEGHAADE